MAARWCVPGHGGGLARQQAGVVVFSDDKVGFASTSQDTAGYEMAKRPDGLWCLIGCPEEPVQCRHEDGSPALGR